MLYLLIFVTLAVLGASFQLRMTLDQYSLEQQNGARAYIRTFGGNAFSYITKEGIEVLGTRKDAADITLDSKPHAGGVPHCFPQFGPGPLVQHGFARGLKFIAEERAKKLSFDRMIYKLVSTEETKKVFPYDFEYRFDVTLRDDSLEWDVAVINKGDKPFEITTGLHTYFDISSLKNIVIEGPFKGAQTVDKVTGASGVGSSNQITINSPVDVLYKGVNGPITITDTGKKTKVTIERQGYPDAVIWSPFGNEAMGYDRFVCVEPVAASPITIPVGKYTETKFYQKISLTQL